MLGFKHYIIGISAVLGSELIYLCVKYFAKKKETEIETKQKTKDTLKVLFFPDEGLVRKLYVKEKRQAFPTEQSLVLQTKRKESDMMKPYTYDVDQGVFQEMDGIPFLEDMKRHSKSLKHIVLAVEEAERSIVICVYCFTLSTLATAVVQAKKRGVQVRVLLEQEMAEKCLKTVRFLQKHNIEVCCGQPEFLMHHKFAVIDGPLEKEISQEKDAEQVQLSFRHAKNNIPLQSKANCRTKCTDFDWRAKCALMTGSFNWTWNAVVKNNENLVIARDPELVGQYSREFEKLWANRKVFTISS